jgi:hypothetical protein
MTTSFNDDLVFLLTPAVISVVSYYTHWILFFGSLIVSFYSMLYSCFGAEKFCVWLLEALGHDGSCSINAHSTGFDFHSFFFIEVSPPNLQKIVLFCVLESCGVVAFKTSFVVVAILVALVDRAHTSILIASLALCIHAGQSLALCIHAVQSYNTILLLLQPYAQLQTVPLDL